MKRRLLKLMGYKIGSFLIASTATLIFSGRIVFSLKLTVTITILAGIYYYLWDWLWEKGDKK